ncbi:hypothetical protein BWP24_22865 [Vibrio campbellii]|nr:hypothetical protein BWP24_22865 [Vibrio campbellii]
MLFNNYSIFGQFGFLSELRNKAISVFKKGEYDLCLVNVAQASDTPFFGKQRESNLFGIPTRMKRMGRCNTSVVNAIWES